VDSYVVRCVRIIAQCARTHDDARASIVRPPSSIQTIVDLLTNFLDVHGLWILCMSLRSSKSKSSGSGRGCGRKLSSRSLWPGRSAACRQTYIHTCCVFSPHASFGHPKAFKQSVTYELTSTLTTCCVTSTIDRSGTADVSARKRSLVCCGLFVCS